MTVAITRLDLSAADLRARAARADDAKAARRMLAIALVMEGLSRQAAAEACAMDRQTLRDWVHRYNASGPAGLYDQPRRNGPPPRLSPEQQAQVAAWVEQGPEFERDGVVRWRCIDLQQRIKAGFAVAARESTVGKLLHRLNFTRRQPRPYHPKKDAAAQAAFKRMARPVCKQFRRHDLTSLHQRIRPMGMAPAKMEVRASWSP
jgi:transposase